MTYPVIYDVTYSYSNFQQSQGNSAFPGTQVDADLAGLADSLANLSTFMQGVMRSDGALQNGAVTFDSLAPALQTAGLAPATAWATGVAYLSGNSVVINSNLYRLAVPHTSGVFATDLAAGKWAFVAALLQGPQGAAGAAGPQGPQGVAGTADASALLVANNLTDVANKAAANAALGLLGYADLNAAVAGIGATKATLTVVKPYALTANLTVPPNIQLIVLQGGTITSGGFTLAVNGPFTAPPISIFSGFTASSLSFSRLVNQVGFPEWFGAVTGDNTVNCEPAITLCDKLLPVTQLQAADYYITTTIKRQTPQRKLRGSTETYGYHTGGTRIAINHASNTGIQVGLDADPGTGIGTFPQDISTSGLTVFRSVVPASPATSATTDGCRGISVQWCLACWFDRVQSWENVIGWWFGGAVNTKMNGCYSGRSIPCAVSTHDHFEAYFLDGTSGLAAAGGNASLYFTRSGIGCGLSTAIPSSGFTFNSAGADVFVDNCEIATCNNGVTYVGSTGGAKAQSGDDDIHFTNCVFDGIFGSAFLFQNVAPGGMIDVTDCYVGLATGTGGLGFNIQNSSGSINIEGGQVVGWPSTAGSGILISNSTGVTSRTKILDCAFPVTLSGAESCRIEDTIINLTRSVSGRGAVEVTTSDRCYFAPILKGAVNIASYGVNLGGAGNSYCEINATLVHPTPASSNKIRINGAIIAAVGASGTHIISGVIG